MALEQYVPRYQDVVVEFHGIRDHIPPAFKTAFAKYELDKKGVSSEQVQDQDLLATHGEIELTLSGLLRECGRDEEYIKVNLSKNVRELAKSGFDFLNDELIVEFNKGSGRGDNRTRVLFTPKGYLGAIVKLSDHKLGKAFRNKYINFLLNSATFTAKLDMIYTEQMRTIRERNGVLSLENNRMRDQVNIARLALNSTTNNTNLSFWAHMTAMCKTHGKLAPRFLQPWNTNAQIIHNLRLQLYADGEVYKPENSAWLYCNSDVKQQVIETFDQLGLI